MTKHRNNLLYNVDDELCSYIQKQTEEDNGFWSLPNQEHENTLHGLFQYPAMMVPIVQRWLIETIIRVQPNIQSIIDPFVGAGTSLVSAMHKGLNCYGQDINPMAVLLTRTRTGPQYATDLPERVVNLVDIALNDTSNQIEIDFPNINKWFETKVAVELSRLRRAIQREDQLWFRRFLWVALAETIRLTSNDRTSTFKLHMRPVEQIKGRDVSPISMFAAIASQNVKRLHLFLSSLEQGGYLKQQEYVGDVKVVLHDTKTGIMSEPKQQFYDLLITSPPYGDNTSTVPYGQHSYLPLRWIDLSDIDLAIDSTCLRTTQEIDRKSIGGRTKIPIDDIRILSEQSEILGRVLKQLQLQPVERTMRVASFYHDFFMSLDHIVNSLHDNSYMVWTVGNRTVGGISIPNDQILCDYFDRLGVKLVTHIDRTIHKKRMPKRNGIVATMAKERILIFRKCTHEELL